VVFGPGIPAVDVPTRLKYYEFVRKNRADTIQEFSRSMVIGKKETADPRVVQAFTFDHDVVAYAKQALSAMFIPKASSAPSPVTMPLGAAHGRLYDSVVWTVGGGGRRE
jgi:hypothetical protein